LGNKFWCNAVLILLIIITPLSLHSQNVQQQLRTAEVLVSNHHYDSALKLYEEIYKNDKRNLSAIIGIKKCLVGMQEYDRLILFLEDALKSQPERSPLYIDLGEAFFLNDNRDKAFDVWNSHLNRNLNDVGVYRLLAMAMIRQRLYDEAIDVYLKAINNLKQQEALHVDIANLYKAQLNYEKASEHYLYYFQTRPKQIAYLQRQLLSLSDKGKDITPVVNALNAFLLKNPDEDKVREILAGLYLKDKQFNRAFEIYKSLETEKSNGIYIQKYAREALANKAYTHAIEGFEYILLNYKSSLLLQQTHYDLGQSYASLAYSQGDSEESAKTMEKAKKIYNDIISKEKNSVFIANSYIRLAEIYLEYYFDLDNAIVNYKNFLKRNSDKKTESRILIQLGDTYLTKNQMDDALKIYKLAIHKDFIHSAQFKIAEVHFYNGEFKEAEDSYSQLVNSIKPNNPLMNNILTRTMLIKSSAEDSLSLSRYARADLLKFQKKFAQAAEEFDKLSQEDNILRAQAGIFASKLYTQLNKYQESKRVLSSLLDKIPEDKDIDEIIFLLAQSEENLQNLETALDLYHQLLTHYPNSLLIHQARDKARMLSVELSKDQS
jgi:tetratricopeptide (TPR) repeat protein